ncbi:MAG: hypothetical protein ACK559_17745, partial [bacterium]
EGEELAAHESRCQRRVARHLLYEPLVERLALLGLRGRDQARAAERGDVIGDAALSVPHEALGPRVRRIVAEHDPQRVEEGALAVGAVPIEDEQRLFPRAAGEAVPD